MDVLLHLWLPILLSAVAVFVLSAASHTLLPWRIGEYRHVPTAAAVQAALKDLAPGQYVFPAGPDPKSRGSAEALAAWAAGPSGWLTIVPPEPLHMGRNLGQSFLVYLVVSFLSGYLAAFALGSAPPAVAVVRLVSTVGILAYAVGTSFNSIWFSRPWRFWVADLVDAVVQSFAMAGIFAWLWPR